MEEERQRKLSLVVPLLLETLNQNEIHSRHNMNMKYIGDYYSTIPATGEMVIHS